MNRSAASSLPLRLASSLLAAAVLATACSSSDWPPFRQRLTTYFTAHRATLEMLEREMAADGYRRMDSRILSGAVAMPSAPPLDDRLIEKYRGLIRPGDVELLVSRTAYATEFEMLSEPVAASLYLFRFVHGEPAAPSSACDAGMRLDPCGQCSIDLGGTWQLEYEWFPQDLDAELRECR